MKKSKVPSIKSLIDECIIKLAAIIRHEDNNARTIKECLDALISVDKNERDYKKTFTTIAPNLSDEEIDAAIAAHKKDLGEDE